MIPKNLYLLRIALLHLLVFSVPFAYAQVTITEDFDYGTSAGSLTGQNGGTGFSAGWTGGTNAYTPTSLSFGTMTSVGGAMRVMSGANAVRDFTKKLAPSGPISGSFLFQVSSVSGGSVLMLGLGDGGAQNNQGFAIGLMPANDGQSGKPAVATKGASSMGALTAGASLSANTTYMYSFSYANGSTTAWILTPEQYATFNSGGILDQTAMNAATIGTGPTDIVGRAASTRTGDLPNRITQLYSYFFSGGTMLVDQISITGVPTLEVTLGFDCVSGTIGDYYNGGAGPNLGISFASSSASSGQLSTDPGPLINVPGGFSTGFAVSYSLSVGFRINVYDGLNGTGTLLGTADVNGNTGTAFAAFSGTAKSVTLGRYSNAGVYDNLTFGSTTIGTPIVESTVEINVQGNNTNIADGATSATITNGTNFSQVGIYTSSSQVFTIQSTGTTGLGVSNITIAGTNQSEFAVTGIPLPTTVAAGSSATFTVTFTPLAIGSRNAVIHVMNDDCNESDYDFAVQGTGTDINKAITSQTGGAAFVFNNEPSTVGYEFSINQPITVATLGFYDQNSDGLATAHPVGIFDLCGTLLMSGTVTTGTSVALTNGYRYVQITPAVLGAGTYRIGAVVFNGGGNDAFLHNVTTLVNDPIVSYAKGVLQNGSTTLRYPSELATSTGLSEKCCLGPNFQFVVGGIPPGTPDINLQGNSLDIHDGTTAVATTTGTDFGTVTLNTPVSQTFTIQNVGTSDLIVSGTSLTGVNQNQFAVAGIPLPTTITSGNSITFTLTLTPTISGTLSATINIVSNDCDETPYDFAVRGMADPASLGGTLAGSATVCSGTNSTTLTLSGQTGAVQWWESSSTANFATSTTISNTSLSLVVTDLSLTTYYRAVVKSGVNPETRSSSVTVTVAPTVTASITPFPSLTICAGQSLTLTGYYATSAPPPPGSSPDPSPAPAPSPSPAPAPSPSPSPAPAPSPSPAPAPPPTPNSFRAGARKAAPLAIPNYNWSTGEFTETISFIPTSSTVISLTAYNGTCYADPVSVSITVNDTPHLLTITATPGLVLLGGQSATLTVSGADSYTWSANAGGIESVSVVVNTAGTYSVTGSTRGCSSTTSAVVSLTTSANPGAALAFNGVNNLVSATGLLGTSPDEFTVEFWLNPSVLSDYNQEISIGSTGNGAWNGFTFHSTSGGAVYVGTDIGSRMTPGELPLGTVTLNTWQHFAYTFKKGIGKFYKNGVLLSTKEHTAPASFEMLRLAYGCCNPLNGLLDELRIWTVARNCDEINQQRNCELTGSEQNLLLYYNFNQGDAGGDNTGLITVIDAAGGDHNGAMTGFDLTGTTSNWVAPGAVVSGSSCAAVVYPEINLTANSLTLVDGQTAIATADNTNFGSLSINGSKSLSYTIENNGSSDLIVSSITRSGSGSAAFAVSSPTLPMTIAGGSSTTFAVAFNPTTSNTFNAVIHVNSNDCDEGDYDFAVQGVADPTSVGGTVLGSTTVCTSTNSTTLSLTNQVGTVLKWQLSLTDDFASTTDVSGSASVTSLTVENLTQTTYYRAVVKSGVNPATNSGSATVVVGSPLTMVITPNPGLTITVGSSATLTASVANSYTWSANAGGVNSRSVVVSTDGVYSVTGTTGGCSATASVQVSVTQPTAPACNLTVRINPSAEAVCQDATLTLTAEPSFLDDRNSTLKPTGQARLAMPMLTYAWKAPAGAGLNSTSSEEVTASFTTSGVKTFTVIITDANNCTAMNTVSVTVKPLPTVTIVFPQSATVSPGPVVTVPVGQGLSYQVSGGVQYNRMIVIDRLNGFEIRTVKETTDGIFPLDQAGAYTITVTGENGCQRTVTGVIVGQ